mmetsp:Transcript_6650/g.17418  ORF Transcript_6650/g.17418 Transcript_6650/m.17418 type:complete len:259 (-) Transcript_6650:286-1062(-)
MLPDARQRRERRQHREGVEAAAQQPLGAEERPWAEHHRRLRVEHGAHGRLPLRKSGRRRWRRRSSRPSVRKLRRRSPGCRHKPGLLLRLLLRPVKLRHRELREQRELRQADRHLLWQQALGRQRLCVQRVRKVDVLLRAPTNAVQPRNDQTLDAHVVLVHEPPLDEMAARLGLHAVHHAEEVVFIDQLAKVDEALEIHPRFHLLLDERVDRVAHPAMQRRHKDVGERRQECRVRVPPRLLEFGEGLLHAEQDELLQNI